MIGGSAVEDVANCENWGPVDFEELEMGPTASRYREVETEPGRARATDTGEAHDA